MPIRRGAAAVLACTLILTLGFLACGDGDGGGTGVETTGTVSGQVTVVGGSGVSGATLSLQRTGASTRTTTSGTTGTFSFVDVEAGSWTLGITPPAGFSLASGQQASVPVSVTAGQTTTVDFSLELEQGPNARIRASVTADGSARSGVQVRLFDAGAATARSTQTTGSDGTTTFVGLDDGDYDVEVVPPSGLQLASGEQAKKQVTATDGLVADVSFELESTGGGSVVTINVNNNFFDPADVTISPGTTIRWVAQAGGHTVTPDGHSQWSEAVFTAAGQTFEVTFNSTGTFNYYCDPHRSLGMTGVIRVQ